MRFPRLAAAAALLALALGSSPAEARVDVTRQYGHWSVIEGVATDGQRMCGVSSMSADSDRRFLGIKYFFERDKLQIHISKSSWSIPMGTPVAVAIEFNGFPGAWSSSEGSYGDGRFIYVHLGKGAAVNFLTEFSRASSGVIRFGGTEGAWSMNLTGSSAAVSDMLECIRRGRGGTTQPYSSSQSSSQPYSSSTRPSQPYQPSAPRSEPVAVTGRERRT